LRCGPTATRPVFGLFAAKGLPFPMLTLIQGHRWLSLQTLMVGVPYRAILFAGLLLFIAAVSVHDAVLVVLLEDLIQEFERNPVGSWLIEIAQGSVWLFVFVKLMGTSLVGAAQVMIYQWRPHLALASTTVLAGFQLVLLLYLSVG
jgi:hypothetical protein